MAIVRIIAPGALHARVGSLGCGGDPDTVLAWVKEMLGETGDTYTVRHLPHGEQPQQGEETHELRGHHGHYGRLAVRK